MWTLTTKVKTKSLAAEIYNDIMFLVNTNDDDDDDYDYDDDHEDDDDDDDGDDDDDDDWRFLQ